MKIYCYDAPIAISTPSFLPLFLPNWSDCSGHWRSERDNDELPANYERTTTLLRVERKKNRLSTYTYISMQQAMYLWEGGPTKKLFFLIMQLKGWEKRATNVAAISHYLSVLSGPLFPSHFNLARLGRLIFLSASSSSFLPLFTNVPARMNGGEIVEGALLLFLEYEGGRKCISFLFFPYYLFSKMTFSFA